LYLVYIHWFIEVRNKSKSRLDADSESFPSFHLNFLIKINLFVLHFNAKISVNEVIVVNKITPLRIF